MNPSKELTLHAYAQEQIGKPFEYGVNDCGLFAAGALDLLTGGNLATKLKGQWSSEKEAYQYAIDHGSIGQHWQDEGCEQVKKEFIQTGDFPVIEHKPYHFSAGVCLGAKTAISTSDKGVVLAHTAKLRNVTGVWRAR